MTTVRPYLRAGDRRRALLEAAARVFSRQGYAGLSMVAVAREAGVSRRLVYDHFPDLTSLYEAFFDERARRYVDAVEVSLAGSGDDPVRAFELAFAHLLDMAPDDQRAIRLLLADTGISELDDLRARFCEHVEQRWLGRFTTSDVEADIAKALLWTMVDGLLTLAARVSRDEVSRDAAAALATALVARLPAVLAVKPVPA
jgi:AcrR family transcriptional regulator